MRMRRYSRVTEQGYVGWHKRYVLFQKEVSGRMRHPGEMGAAEVEAFLTHLAVNRNVSASTQNQALNALVFLYREVLEQPIEGLDAMRARPKKNLPVVLAVEEVRGLLAGVKGDAGLAVKLLYGCGLRVAEVQKLRIKDVDVAGGKLEVRGGKGDKDRVLTLPRSLRPAIEEHLGRVRGIFDADRRDRVPGVQLPQAGGSSPGWSGRSKWTAIWP